MTAWADGLNFYLAKHPEVKPRVITHFEPWMALSFTEGRSAATSRRSTSTQLEAFYGKRPATTASAEDARGRSKEPPARTVSRSRRRTRRTTSTAPHQSAHVVLFPLRAADDERRRAQRLRRVDLGTVLHLSGIQRATRLDAHVERRRCDRRVSRDGRRRRATSYFYKYGSEERPVTATQDQVPYKTASGMATKDIHRLSHAPRPGRSQGRTASGSPSPHEQAGEGAHAVVQAHEGEELQAEFEKVDGAAHQLVEQHDLRRPRWATSRTFTPIIIPKRDPKFDWTKPVDGSDPATEYKGLLSFDESPNLIDPASGWVYNSNNWPWSRRRGRAA